MLFKKDINNRPRLKNTPTINTKVIDNNKLSNLFILTPILNVLKN